MITGLTIVKGGFIMAKKAYVFLTDGFEETEAVTTVDILRRANIECIIVSLTGHKVVTGSHNINIEADILFDDNLKGDAFILPGGPGYLNYFKHEALNNLIKEACSSGSLIAAICAAPNYLGSLLLLEGKKAVCFPGMEDGLKGAIIGNNIVEKDDNIITSKGPGTTPFFAIEIIDYLLGTEIAQNIKENFKLNLI